MQKQVIQKTSNYVDNENALQFILALEEKLRVAKKVRDKGGCVVVEGSEDAVITTYNYKVKH
jgi:hypothetical protein